MDDALSTVLKWKMDDADRERRIAEMPVRELARKISVGEITAIAALAAYRRRARKAHAALNCCLEFLDAAADAQATELDRHLADTGKTVGPLHGVPFTLKDHFHLAGTRLTMGSPELASFRSKTDSAVARALLDAGGVCFAKTTMSEKGQLWTGGNPVTGDTLNAFDTSRTAGGSSSGEGALAAVGGSAFGVGSDVGGSVRIPAAFNGHCSLKPTADRAGFSLVNGKLLLNARGDYGILAAAGPMGRRVDDLALVMEVFASSLHGLHPRFPPVPFRGELYAGAGKKLTYGCWLDSWPTNPPVTAGPRRAVEATAAALRELGHKVVPFEAPASVSWQNVDWVYNMLATATMNNGNIETAGVEGDGKDEGPFEPMPTDKHHHQDYYALADGSRSFLFSDQATLPGGGRISGAAPWQKLLAMRDSMRDDMFIAMKRQGCDVLLSPTLPTMAPTIADCPRVYHVAGKEGSALLAPALQNLLDCPAGVVPVARFTQQDVTVAAAEAAAGGSPLAKLHAADAQSGMPLTVSVTAPPWEDELCLRGMREVEKARDRSGSGELDWCVEKDNIAQLDRLTPASKL